MAGKVFLKSSLIAALAVAGVTVSGTASAQEWRRNGAERTEGGERGGGFRAAQREAQAQAAPQAQAQVQVQQQQVQQQREWRGNADANRGNWQQRGNGDANRGNWQQRGSRMDGQVQAQPQQVQPQVQQQRQWNQQQQQQQWNGQQRGQWSGRQWNGNRTDGGATVDAQRNWQGRNGTYTDPSRTRDYRNRGYENRSGEWNRNDGRWQRGDNNRSYTYNRNGSRGWNNTWRNDNRYDWRGYRNSHRDIFRAGRYRAPYGGWSYRPLGIGFTLDSIFFGQDYWIDDPYAYRLPPVDGPYRWVRYYDDVLLVDIYSGEVVDVIRDFFY